MARHVSPRTLRQVSAYFGGISVREVHERSSAETEASFGSLLRHHRLAQGLTQAELAERSSLSTRAISDLERGLKQRPQRETLRLLMNALDISPAERTEFESRARRLHVSHTSPSNSLVAPIVFPVPDVSAAFAFPASLPTPLTPLVGRSEEVTSIVTSMHRDADAVRLLTITGPGGAGKTRLAIALAVGLRDDYPDGVVFISLAALNDPSLLLPTIAHALGIQETSTRSLLARVTDALRDRRVLLVLDNFEQLVAAAAVVTAILTVCPLLSVITTSREALRVQGEHEFPLAPLPVPAVSAALDVLGGSPAVALFCQRARAVRRDFTLNAANAEAVRAICAPRWVAPGD